MDYAVVTIPYWFLLVLTAIIPAVSIRRRIRQLHRKRNNLCQQCGYDLRATADRCPECGTRQIPAPAPALTGATSA
jgi:hypothetical protein